MTKLMIFSLLSVAFNGLAAQICSLYPLSLEERVTEAALVVEARVLERHSFAARGHLYTAHRVEVYRAFKGLPPAPTVLLITEGGTLEGRRELITPSLQLSPQQAGIFFLKPSRWGSRALNEMAYEVAGSVQGGILYDEVRGQAIDPFHTYPDVHHQLYPQLERASKQAPLVFHPYVLQPAEHGAQRAQPIIDGFAPASLSAGTGTVLTITGSNFEAYDGGITSAVLFSNPNNGGATFTPCPDSEILSWNDTEITLRLPSLAGSGPFQVRNASDELQTSATALDVTFNYSNFENGGQYHGALLQNENGTGGYTLQYSTNTADNGISFDGSAATNALANALAAWQVSTAFNVEVGTSTTVNTPDDDGLQVVMFDNDTNPLPAGVLARTYSFYTSCDGGNTWYVDGFDLVFRRDGTGGVNWNFGPAATGGCCFDFQSIALHELGHAHQLGHINAVGEVMHYAIANGTDVRILANDSDVAGGQYVMNESQSLNTCGGTVTNMVPYAVLATPLLSFTGEAHPRANLLRWEQVISTGLAGFTVEASTDGERFEARTFIAAKREGEVGSYAFRDTALFGPKHYYRILSHGLNGQQWHSAPIEVKNWRAGRPPFTLYPNPAQERLSLQWAGPLKAGERVHVRVMDAQGRTVYTHTLATSSVHSWALSAWPSGVYFLQARLPKGKLITRRFIKH